jgi:hypothetical protein
MPGAAAVGKGEAAERALRRSGLVGVDFRVQPQPQNRWVVETDHCYTSAEELKLSLLQVTKLLGGGTTLRARLLGSEEPVEASLGSDLARSPLEALRRIRLVPYRGVLPPPGSAPQSTTITALPHGARPTLPVLGEPLVPGQPVADPVRGSGVLLAAGRPIPVRIEQELTVSGETATPIAGVVPQSVLDEQGSILVPRGTTATGRIVSTAQGARLVVDTLVIDGQPHRIAASTAEFPSYPSANGGVASGPAAGALIGGLLGGGVGALLGGLFGNLFGAPAPPPRVVVFQPGTLYPRLVDPWRVTTPEADELPRLEPPAGATGSEPTGSPPKFEPTGGDYENSPN